MNYNHKPNIAVLSIDNQNDFCAKSDTLTGQKGALYVEGAYEDTLRASDFIRLHSASIKQIFATFDLHHPMQIFHAAWWVNSEGQQPAPFTLISYQDILSGKWIPQIEPQWTLRYIKELESQDGFSHCIWPNHCEMGSWGQLMVKSLQEAINEWQSNYGSMAYPKLIHKGWNPGYEFFGIFKPQIQVEDDVYTHFNYQLVEELNAFDKVYAFGEAKSHCFGLSIKQLLDEANGGQQSCQELLGKIVVLEDCTSDIPGFEGAMDSFLEDACTVYGMQIKNSTDITSLSEAK